MPKSFDDLAAKAADAWSDDANTVHEAASRVFRDEVSVQVELGRLLASARKARHLSQPDLAEATGVQQPEISRIENGLGNPTIETLSRLSTAVGQKLVLTPQH